jgi:aspartate aminotransferase
MVRLAGAEPRILPTRPEDGFRLDPEALREAVTEKTKLLVLNSPSNPTGTVLPPDTIRRIVEICLEHNILVLSDEIYEYLLYDGAEHLSPASLSDEAARLVITVAGFSKTFSMTGWRLGTLVAEPGIAKAVASLQSQTTSNATTFAQYGALAALTDRKAAAEAVGEMRATFDRRRVRLLEGLRAIPGIECHRSTGAFYLFPDIGSFGVPPKAFAESLLEKKLVAVVAGEGFGSDTGIRLSYATSDERIETGLARLAEFVEEEYGA